MGWFTFVLTELAFDWGVWTGESGLGNLHWEICTGKFALGSRHWVTVLGLGSLQEQFDI